MFHQSRSGIGTGIGYWHWDKPILFGIGCLAWYRSNPMWHVVLRLQEHVTVEEKGSRGEGEEQGEMKKGY